MDLADGYVCSIGSLPRDAVIHATHSAGSNTRSARAHARVWANAPSLRSLRMFRVRCELLHGCAEVPRLLWLGTSPVSLSTVGPIGTGTRCNLYQSDHSPSLPYITSRSVRPVLRPHLPGFHGPRSNPLSFHEHSPRPATKHYIPSGPIRCFRRASSRFDCRVGLCATPTRKLPDRSLISGESSYRASAPTTKESVWPAP